MLKGIHLNNWCSQEATLGLLLHGLEGALTTAEPAQAPPGANRGSLVKPVVLTRKAQR